MQGGSRISEPLSHREPSPRGHGTAQVKIDSQKERVQDGVADSSPKQTYLESAELQADVETASKPFTEVMSALGSIGHDILSKVSFLNNKSRILGKTLMHRRQRS